MHAISPFRTSLLFLIVALIAAHASATIVPGQVQVHPAAVSRTEGTPVSVSEELEIIPSGSTTFAETHTLSLSTDLNQAHWQVVVYVDGVQGAVIPKEGNRVYVNGYLLSYPTTRDVSVQILLEGMVPPLTRNQELMILRFAELNSQGSVISESENKVTVAAQDTKVPSPPAPAEVASPVATPAGKLPLSYVPVLGALIFIFSWLCFFKRGI